ncbi:ABC transporter permease subunit [Burkholderia sp. GbtcB21]|uniref:ABC transporter permease n=1 Tax=Burkholderia sp. GbtcB21 TaxID=2824766 RepID=UPI0020C6F119|nr:ABC transporter permease subunit [Burkholderia sp. GbtcB21]
MEHHADILHGRHWHPRAPDWRDPLAVLLVLGLVVLVGAGARQMVGPLAIAQHASVTLAPDALPGYTLRTVMRMLAALFASLCFTFTYATLAAKSRRAEMVLIPLLDVLQSVPILGYLSFTVVFFVSLFPGNLLGAELAAIFAIFTSQAWNMAFSFYQSLRMVPHDLDEASRSLRLSAWQRFWRLEVPFAMPGLIWNTMMSMSGGWFFVVASEAISVGNLQIALPGVGSYVARAIEQRDLHAVGYAILAMTVAIGLYDQLLFRPMVAWADKFRFEQTASRSAPHSWVLDLLRRSSLIRQASAPLGSILQRAAHARLALPRHALTPRLPLSRRAGDAIWLASCAAGLAWLVSVLLRVAVPRLMWSDVAVVAHDGMLTLARVVVLIAIASIVWVPLGVLIGLRPRLTERVQPIAQFLAAFPANLLFPMAVFLIVRFGLAPKIWLSPLMILGTQWYILFNVIAGTTALPNDLREAAASLRLRPHAWWRKVVLPGIFPYYVTGVITASGGAWNASIVSEAVSWGPTALDGGGLGAYIAHMTVAGDYLRIALGITMMSILVIATNRLLWRPLYVYAERRARLD